MSRPEPPSPLWQHGWYQAARHLPSPNHGPRPEGVVVDLLVLHSISLPPGVYGGNEVQRLFTNRLDPSEHPWFEQLRGLEVSAHFYIRRDGALWQFVSCDQRAWHAGRSRHRGRENCNDFSIGIELEGLEDEPFEPAQYDALVRLCSDIARQYPITSVAGHEHIAPGRKRDPGKGFEWPALRQRLGWQARCFPSVSEASSDP